ncbi:MAG: hypothetical protein ACKO3K_14275, partial [Cuspidothrix sp.]|uniref:hypothetical protein n=1 Tax=Cylindrospermopsis raciborskii TaxID=77022 RepID=UPI0038D00F6A
DRLNLMVLGDVDFRTWLNYNEVTFHYPHGSTNQNLGWMRLRRSVWGWMLGRGKKKMWLEWFLWVVFPSCQDM